MPQLLGFVLVLALVTGALVSVSAGPVLAALPWELALIGGTALGTLLIANGPDVSRGALVGLWLAIRGPRWREADFTALLVVLSDLMRRARQGGVIAIEADIETPAESDTIQRAPRLVADRQACRTLCDAFRLMALDPSRPERVDLHLERSLEQAGLARMRPVQALHTVADALPALGIVAAVLGIIKTMGAIDQSTAIIGAMIATALMGTFLGVFLAYGLVGPLATRFGQVVERELVALEVIAAAVSAHARGTPPSVAIELARSVIPVDAQPPAGRLDHALQAARFGTPRIETRQAG